MLKTLILTKDAQQDLDDTYLWYEEHKSGLGQEFMRCIDTKLSEINNNPLLHQIIFGDFVRRALTNRFPFSVYYVNEKDLITVFAILHQRRGPKSWKSRI